MTTIPTLTVNPSIDKSTDVAIVVPDEKLRCGPPRYDAGGGGINVSRVVRRLGGETLALFTAGGPAGQLLERLLADEDVACRPLPIEAWTRENLMVFGEEAEQQYRFLFDGPEILEAEWRGCLEALDGIHPRPAFAVASGSLPPGIPDDFYAQVARWARAHGVRLVLDASGAALEHAVEEGVYLLKPNYSELEALVGRRLQGDDDIEEACRDLVSGGACEVLLVSLGAAGAVLATPERLERLSAPTVPIASKVGAGDSTVAATVLGLARGWEPARAARYGIAAGAAAVMTPRTELCRSEDVEALFARMERAYAGAA